MTIRLHLKRLKVVAVVEDEIDKLGDRGVGARTVGRPVADLSLSGSEEALPRRGVHGRGR